MTRRQATEKKIAKKRGGNRAKASSVCGERGVACDMTRRQATEWKLKTEEDVVVRLLHPSHQSCLLALPLHSYVLFTRSEFFAARLSWRWNPTLTHNSTALSSNADVMTSGECDNFGDKNDATLLKACLKHKGLCSIDITMPDLSAVTTYKKCLELMYVPRRHIYPCMPFSNVKDAISMLYVAAELLFHDCIEHCMQCLEMLPLWTEDEESSIRSTLSSLHLAHINEDLAARLSLSKAIPPLEPICTMRRMLVCVLQMACEKLPKLLPALKSIDASKPISEATVSLAWNANLDIIKASLKQKVQGYMFKEARYSNKDVEAASTSLLWLLSKLVALEAADAVVRAFVEDTQLAKLTEEVLKGNAQDYETRPLICVVLSVLDQIMRLIFGKVLLSQSVRKALIVAWLPVVYGLRNFSSFYFPNVADSIAKLISSLPVLDREQIYKMFMRCSNDPSLPDLNASFGPWCEMLRKAHVEHGDGQEGLLSIEDA